MSLTKYPTPQKRIAPWSLSTDEEDRTIIVNQLTDEISRGNKVKAEVLKILPSNITLPHKALYYKAIVGDDHHKDIYYLVFIREPLSAKIGLVSSLNERNKQISIVQLEPILSCDFEVKHCVDKFEIKEAWLLLPK